LLKHKSLSGGPPGVVVQYRHRDAAVSINEKRDVLTVVRAPGDMMVAWRRTLGVTILAWAGMS